LETSLLSGTRGIFLLSLIELVFQIFFFFLFFFFIFFAEHYKRKFLSPNLRTRLKYTLLVVENEQMKKRTKIKGTKAIYVPLFFIYRNKVKRLKDRNYAAINLVTFASNTL